jgi:hypothetical protein
VTKRTHLVFPFPVYYSSLCFPTPAYSKESFASLRITSKLLTSKFLLGEIREKGGAYGGGAAIQPSGSFAFYSYRDPRGIETFDSYRRAIDWALKPDSFGPDEVHEAKLGVFQVGPSKLVLEPAISASTVDVKTVVTYKLTKLCSETREFK